MFFFIINKYCNNRKVIFAVSGGIDSLIGILMFKNRNYNVISLNFKLIKVKFQTIIYYNNIIKLCIFLKNLNIKHYILDYKYEFYDSVIISFIKKKKCNIKIVPCFLCNKFIKLSILNKIIYKLNLIGSTGHYIRIKKYKNKKFIFKSIDKIKNQSYFINNFIIFNNLLFFLGCINKYNIKSISKILKFIFIKSKDLCFNYNKNSLRFNVLNLNGSFLSFSMIKNNKKIFWNSILLILFEKFKTNNCFIYINKIKNFLKLKKIYIQLKSKNVLYLLYSNKNNYFLFEYKLSIYIYSGQNISLLQDSNSNCNVKLNGIILKYNNILFANLLINYYLVI